MVCRMCEEDLDESKFTWRDKAHTKRVTACKPCTNVAKKNWYANNNVAAIGISKKSKAKSRSRNRSYIADYLGGRCCDDCDEADPVVLEFDHIGTKNANVSVLVSEGASIERLRVEIDLCEVVCANCHRRRTARRGKWAKWVG